MLTAAGEKLIVKMDSPPRKAACEVIHLIADKASVHLFVQETGARIS